MVFRIAMQVRPDSACHHHRLLLPARHCANDLADDGIIFAPFGDATPNLKFDCLAINGPVGPESVGTVLRLVHGERRLCWGADDDYWRVPDWNPAQATPAVLSCTEAVLKLADVVCVSTPDLHADFRPRTSSPVYVAPNMVDPDDYLPRWQSARKRSWVSILWQGSITHQKDLEILVEPITRVLDHFRGDDRPEIIFWGDCHPEIRRRHMNAGIAVLQPEEFRRYFQALADLSPDIVLAPLCDDPFNHRKSSIRILEAFACGAAVIASPVGPYASVIQHGVNGLLADGESDWVECIARLVSNRDERERLARAGWNTMMENHNWHQPRCREPWLNVWRACASGA